MFEIKLQTEATLAIFRLLKVLRFMLMMMMATMVFHMATNDVCGWFHRFAAPVVHDLALAIPTTRTTTAATTRMLMMMVLLTTTIAIMNTRLRWQFRG